MITEDVLRVCPELTEEEAAEIAAVVNKYLNQMVVVKNAEFAMSADGRRKKSGAMRRLNKSLTALNNTKGD